MCGRPWVQFLVSTNSNKASRLFTKTLGTIAVFWSWYLSFVLNMYNCLFMDRPTAYSLMVVTSILVSDEDSAYLFSWYWFISCFFPPLLLCWVRAHCGTYRGFYNTSNIFKRLLKYWIFPLWTYYAFLFYITFSHLNQLIQKSLYLLLWFYWNPFCFKS